MALVPQIYKRWIMSGTVNTRIQLKRDTTANWNSAIGLIPLEGELIIYTDYKTIIEEVGGETKTTYVPGIKIGDGRAYVQDLPFIDDKLREELLEHIGDTTVHVTAEEKVFWNNKLNVNEYVVNGALILNRN